MSEAYKYDRETVEFFQGLAVDGYRMPDGNFRVGITTASIVAGFAENYLRRGLGDPGTRLQPLLELGFSGETLPAVRVTQTGDRQERTITLKDFVKLLRYADKQGRMSAGAILDALSELSLLDFFRDAFDEDPLSINEKRRIFYEIYAQKISPENWRQMDKEEILRLALPGDESHLEGGHWND